jgi:protein TonB
MALTEDSLHADPEERPPPLARSIEPSPRAALFGATLLYVLLFAGLTADYRFGGGPQPAPQEIPIEIVSEPPPPPQPQETPKPQPSPQQQEHEYIPPAYDAPRLGKSKDKNSETAEKSEETPPKPTPQPDPKPQIEKTEAAAKEDTKAPDLEKPAPDAPPAPVADGETPPQQQARADPKPAAEAPPSSAAPGIVFNSGRDPGAEVMEALSAPGRARLTYFSTLYGLIRPYMRRPAGSPPRSVNPEGGVIVFTVDGKGRLTYRNIQRSSGWRELDLANLDAVGKASPFPPPPWAPMAVEFDYPAD